MTEKISKHQFGKYKDIFGQDINVTGVAIQFYLVPISHFVRQFKNENVYVKLKDTTIEKCYTFIIILKKF